MPFPATRTLDLLNMLMELRDTAYPDFRLIGGEIETCLISKYPNKTDYWEVVNKRLTQLIVDKYPAILRVMSEMAVSGVAT